MRTDYAAEFNKDGSLNACTPRSGKGCTYLSMRIGKHPSRYGVQAYEFLTGKGGRENPTLQIEHNDQTSRESLFTMDVPDVVAFLTSDPLSQNQSLSLITSLWTMDSRRIRRLGLEEEPFGYHQHQTAKLSCRRVFLR